MDLSVIFATAFMIGFSGAMVPGPLLSVAIGESIRLGFIAAPLLMLGHGLLELALILALLGGLSVFLSQAAVAHVISVIGGLFLIYMGCGIINDVYKGKISFSEQNNIEQKNNTANIEINNAVTNNTATQANSSELADGKRLMRVVILGILVSFSNPYWLLWWATIGLTYITLSLNSGWIGLTAFFSGHILSDLTWYCLVAAAVVGSRKFLNDSVYKGILLFCGVFIIGLGGYFVYNGFFT